MVAAGPPAAYKGREPMSEPAGPTPVTTETIPAPDAGAPTEVGSPTDARATIDTGSGAPTVGGAPTKETPKAKRFTRPRARQARVVIRKVGPWSVLKISFLFYLCVMTVILGAMMILYGVLDAIGALDSVTRLIRDLFADQTFEIHGDWLFTRGLLIGFAMVVLWTLINLFVAFLYNLLSDLIGGVEVTLSERR
jgi:hypothetical protein